MSRIEIPGTHEPGFVERPVIQGAVPEQLRRRAQEEGSRGFAVFTMGECSIIRAKEGGLWHLSIAHAKRHPSWDEIKVARYRLLPAELCFGMLLPPPDEYVNIPEQDHVFHIWETEDLRSVWR